MAQNPIPPARLGLGIVLIAAGAISGIVFLVLGLVGAFASLIRVEAPGSQDLRLEPGGYTVYWESAGMFSEGAKAPAVQVGVAPKDDGPPVTVEPAGLFVSHYSTPGAVGVSIGSFTIERAGDYQVSVSTPPKKHLGDGRISLTRALGFTGVLRIVLVPLALIGAGVGSGLFVLLKRRATPA